MHEYKHLTVTGPDFRKILQRTYKKTYAKVLTYEKLRINMQLSKKLTQILGQSYAKLMINL